MRLRLAPERGLDEMNLYRQIGWTPHPGQEAVIRSTARNRVVSAGRRFGKSEIGGHRLVKEALDTRLVAKRLDEIGKRREFWIVGPSYTDAEKEFRIAWNEVKRLGLGDYLDRPGSYNSPEQGLLTISMWGGRFIVRAKSEKHPESLVGEGLSGVILAEAAKLKESTWVKLVRPTLADFGGWSLMTSTPEGKNWFYDQWRLGQDPNRSDWDSWRMPSWVNPFVYSKPTTDDGVILLRRALRAREPLTPELCDRVGVDPEIAAMAADLSEEAFNQEIGAEFTDFVGRVFKRFDEEIHVGDFTLDPEWTTYAAVDYGFTNPSVWLLIQVDPFGERVRVLGEVYERGLTPEEFAKTIVERGLCPPGLKAFYPDPASPGDTRVLEERLRVRARGGTGGEIRARVDAIRRALEYRNPHLPSGHPDRIPSLQIDRSCTGLIADMLNYRYSDSQPNVNARENPMKKDDHGPEALGRFYAGYFGTNEKRRARVGRATISAT